ncbi:unnamed protein product, partial [Brassica oleracea]
KHIHSRIQELIRQALVPPLDIKDLFHRHWYDVSNPPSNRNPLLRKAHREFNPAVPFLRRESPIFILLLRLIFAPIKPAPFPDSNPDSTQTQFETWIQNMKPGLPDYDQTSNHRKTEQVCRNPNR